MEDNNDVRQTGSPEEALQQDQETEVIPSASQASDGPVDPRTDGVEQDGSDTNGDKPEKTPKKHSKMFYLGVGAVAFLVVFTLIGALLPCSHEWRDATCTEAKVCTKCGETEGEPLGHDWEEATCTEPKTCLRCGLTDGTALGHEVTEWTTTKEATCSEAGEKSGACIRCGQTQTQEIAKVAHTEGEWVTTKQPSVSSTGSVTPGEKVLTCSVCGGTIKTEAVTLEVTTSQVNALRKAASYLGFTAFSHDGLIKQLEFEGFSNEDATFAADYCGADWNEQAAAKAQSYLDMMAFSHSGLVDQLEFEGFTAEQAEYGVSAAGL